jgi:DNA polymerase elongation subunit (family B)
VNVKTPKDFSEIVEKDMRYFKTDKLGLLPTSLLGLKKLRDEYKQNRDGAKTPEEYSKWNNNQMAVKRLMASFYGIVGFQGFGWCDIGLAECITASAREAIREAARLVEEI